MKNRESEKTLVALANAQELVRVVVQGVVGNDVADTIAGSPLTGEIINQITLSQIQAPLQQYL
jgi:hypothetical protein